MYKVSITSQDVEIYQQTVEELDIMAVISAVNRAQLLKRNRRALRSDAGKPKAKVISVGSQDNFE
jgi:hypothetical protein